MKVPTPIEQLNEAYPLFRKAAGEKAIISKARFTRYGPIRLKRGLGLFLNVHHFRHRCLHPISQFVLGNTGKSFWMGKFLGRLIVKIPKCIETGTPQPPSHAWWVRYIKNWIPLGATLHALVDLGNKPSTVRIFPSVG